MAQNPDELTPTPSPAGLAAQLADFLTAAAVSFDRDGDAFVFSLQGRDVFGSAAPGVLRLYTPLIESVGEAEANEAIALLSGAAPLPSEYAGAAAYIMDRTSNTAGLNQLLSMPRTFSAPALGDACELIVEIADTLARQAAGA